MKVTQPRTPGSVVIAATDEPVYVTFEDAEGRVFHVTFDPRKSDLRVGAMRSGNEIGVRPVNEREILLKTHA